MTKRLCFLFSTLVTVPVAVIAQAPVAAPDNPISESEKRIYSMLSGVVIAAAEKMPEESYSFKPTPDVRAFGQLVGHLADSQYYFCSLAAGETTPTSDAEKSKTSKAELVVHVDVGTGGHGDAHHGMAALGRGPPLSGTTAAPHSD